MSIIRSIKQVLGLGPAAENHHWDGSVPNQLSLKRGTPEAPGAELIKALNGVLSFPNQGQSLATNGYVKLPGGLIVQWGVTDTTVGDRPVTFPVQFPTVTGAVSVVQDRTAPPDQADGPSVRSITTSGFIVQPRGILSTGVPFVTAAPVRWLAIGY